MWRRIKAFADRGVELQIICWWFGTPPLAEELAEIHKHARQVHALEIEQTSLSRLRRATDLLTYPLGTSSRRIKGQKLADLRQQVQEFSPDLIFLDGLHGGAIATILSRDLNVPLVTRSHNIEHLYVKKLFNAAIGIKDRIKKYLSLLHLERYEKEILANSALFYDISADDLKFWQQLNFTNGRLLPPICEFVGSPPSDTSTGNPELKSTYDLVFLGNLNTENNVAGVIWFLSDVLPIIRERLPTVTVAIAGFKPVDRIVEICGTAGVSLIVSPVSASDTYQSGKVLINPILTGSGVKIKSIEMLQFGKSIVSTSEGVSGLPMAVKEYFRIADDPVAFADAAIEFLSTDRVIPAIDRQLLATHFGTDMMTNAIAELKSIAKI
ncbi:glycosyl transferase [Chamaesiphon polymorphus CCALA 037]|uniref:Glycosyl transferase n=2 Tax=Chamaesiphon TaxID=217161 RepID=A0A2T1GMW2_9CYAN|nr:glycosyl transferase [Chamaesiphon polymorphus CCALA 037]